MINQPESQKDIGLGQLIVIVDDDESVRDSLLSLTRSVGFRAEAFASAENFLNSKLLDKADCLILDVRMQGMTGLQLQEKLNQVGSKTPIVFITAHYSGQIRNQALTAGAIEFLSKPFRENALLDAINVALQKKEEN